MAIFTPELIIILLVVVLYIGLGFVALCYCERHPSALDALVGQSNAAMVIAWALWPFTSLYVLFSWWSNRILRVGSNEF